MTRNYWNLLWLSPAILGATALSAVAQTAANPAAADSASTMEQVITYGENTGKTRIGQVTSVSQLTDVRPGDWAFQALQSLVERYGCIVGYPDRTFRGNRALTRYEFAAGLNACMDRINELIAASTAELVKKEDLDALKRLQEEFRAELDELRGKVDALEVRTATLEKQQFSTTAKLNAEVILNAGGVFGDDRALTSDQWRTYDRLPTAAARNTFLNGALGLGDSRNVRDNVTVANRVRLNIDASFSGRDRLRTRLQARNITSFSGAVTGTNMSRLGFDGSNSNAFDMSRLEYRFPIGDLTTVFVGGGTNDGLEFNDAIPVFNPLESSGSGAVSRFGRFNPIYRVGTGTGVIINHRFGREFTFGNKLTLSLGYLVPTGDAQSPLSDQGFFNGSYSALAQLAFQVNPNISLGFTYANSYYNTGVGVSGSTGSGFANNPFNSSGTLAAATNVPTAANAYGLQASVRLSPGFIISGWAGLTEAEARLKRGRQINTVTTVGTSGAGTASFGNAADPVVRDGDDATLWNWAVTFAFPDLFKPGNLGGIVFGMPPKVTSNDYGPRGNFSTALATPRRRDEDTSYHIEGFYRFRISDNISLTPGVIVILNPEHNSNNDTIYVGTLRTTFTF